jgi:hypothetical protein
MLQAQRLKILNEFVNDLSVVKGGNIKVTITEYSTHYEPINGDNIGMRNEDCDFLNETLKGAEAFLYYLERKNYIIKKGR